MGSVLCEYVVATVIAFAVTAALRVPKGTECSYRFAVLFGNAGFIGFPVISAVLGKQALLYASIALIPLNLLMFTVGAMLFSGMDGGLKSRCAILPPAARVLVSLQVLLCLGSC